MQLTVIAADNKSVGQRTPRHALDGSRGGGDGGQPVPLALTRTLTRTHTRALRGEHIHMKLISVRQYHSLSEVVPRHEAARGQQQGARGDCSWQTGAQSLQARRDLLQQRGRARGLDVHVVRQRERSVRRLLRDAQEGGGHGGRLRSEGMSE